MESRNVQVILGQMQKSLECSICLEMMSNPVSTNCGHQFCRFCLMEFLERKKQVPCPLCKKIITKRSLTEREQLGKIVNSIRQLVAAFQMDTGELFSPPRGSQVNIIPCTPEPSQPGKDCRVQAEDVTSSGTRKQNKAAADAETDSRSTLRNVPSGKSKSRRGTRGRTKENAAPLDLDTNTEELLKCIADGIHGAIDLDDEQEDPSVLAEATDAEESNIGESAIEKEVEDSDCVNKALLDVIANGSHGAFLSNPDDVIDNEHMDTDEAILILDSKTEASCDLESDRSHNQRVSLEDNTVDKKILDAEIIVLSGDSDHKDKGLQASGNSGSGQYSLFRTPIDPKTAKAKKGKKAKALPARPRRSCRSKATSECKSDDTDGHEEVSELLANGESDFEEPDFLSERKVQHTYNRPKTNQANGTVSSKKVAEWLKNIPAAENGEHGAPAKTSEYASVQDKKGRKKAEKAMQEEGVMGQRIKHLAEQVQHTHKDLLFNEDDFANSPKPATCSLSNIPEVNLKEIEIARSNADLSAKGVESNESEACEIAGNAKIDTGTKIVEQVENEDGMSKTGHFVNDRLLTEEDQIANKSETDQFVKPLRKKRIFKTRSESKCQVSNVPHNIPDENTRDIKDKETVSIPKEEDTKQSKLAFQEKTADLYEFVSSQNTPVKTVKGKKNAKNKSKSAKTKKNPLTVSKYKGKVNGSIKNGKETTDAVQKSNSGKDEVVITASQMEIDKVSANLNQAETYDLLTCTQEAVKEFASEEKRSEANHSNKRVSFKEPVKRVSFREPVISNFIQSGKIDIIGYRKAKAATENEIDGVGEEMTEKEEKGAVDEVIDRDKTVQENADTVKDWTEAEITEKTSRIEKPVESVVDDDDVSEDWRFNDDSSGTDDLDIEPGDEDFEQPNFEIQPEEVKDRLSQAMFENNVLMKSQESEQSKSPDPSVIGETPLIFTLPAFKKKSRLIGSEGSKNKEITVRFQEEKEIIGKQAVVPETPLLTLEPLEDASNSAKTETETVNDDEVNEVDINKMCETNKDLDKVFTDLPSRNVQSSEETQAPSLEIVEFGDDPNIDEKTEMGHVQTDETAVKISDSAEPSLPLSSEVTDSFTQNSDSILLPKRRDQILTKRQQKGNEVNVTGSEVEQVETDADQTNSRDKKKSVEEKVKKGQKRKRSSKKATVKSKKESNQKLASKVPAESITDFSDRDSEVEKAKTRSCRRPEIASASNSYQSDNVESSYIDAIKESERSNENDCDMKDFSQVSVISVESVSQKSVQITEEKPSDKDKQIANETNLNFSNSQVAQRKGTELETNSLNIVPDFVIDEDLSQVSKASSKTKSTNKGSSQTDGKTNREIIDKSASKERVKGKNRSLMRRNSSEESFRQRNLSGVLVSPQMFNSYSPENIFAADSEMPLLESSPFDGTPKPCYLLDDEVVVTHISDDQSKHDVTILTVNHDSSVVGNGNLDDNNSSGQKSEQKADTQKNSQENQRGADTEKFATPSPNNRRRSSRTARGFSKRRRLSEIESNDSDLSSVKSPVPKVPTTPRSSIAPQYKSPLAKYTSPKMIVTHNLSLVGRSPQHTYDTSSSKTLSTPSKLKMVSPGNSLKYSPFVSKQKAAEDDNTHASLGAEIVDVNVEEKDEGSVAGTPLPDLGAPMNSEILSSSKSSTSNKSKRRKSQNTNKNQRQMSECQIDPRCNDSRANCDRVSRKELSEPDRLTNETCNLIPDSHQCTADKIKLKADDNEEMETVNDIRSNPDLNLNSSTEDSASENKDSHESDENEEEESLSSPEFTLDSSDEDDAQEQALEEINKFNEIKEHTKNIVKDLKSTSDSKTKKKKLGADSRRGNISDTIEDDNRFSTRLDSSPVQPEVILESDVESDGPDVTREVSDDSDDDVVTVRRKNVKRAVIDSSSDEDDENSRHMNLTSSSAFSSQSENLSTQDRVALERDLERMESEMKAMKEQLKQNKKPVTPNRESFPVLPVTVDDSDDAMIEADDTGDEMEHEELFLSLPPVSPSRSQEVMEMGDNSGADVNKGDNHVVSEKQDNEEVDKKTTESQMETAPPSLPDIPESLPSERSALKDLDQNVPQTAKGPGEKKLLSFIASSLSVQQIQEVKKLAAVNDVKFYNRFNRSVTHVIVKPDPADDRLCDRTLKFFQGVANKCWIVNQFWVSDSREVGYLLPEGAYEIQGDTANGETHHGPKRSRLSKDKLFRDMEFALIGDNAYLSRDSLRELIETCGGSVVEIEALVPGSDKSFVVSCTDIEEEDGSDGQQIMAESKNLYKRYHLLTFTREWVLDSITMYKLQPLQDYIITKVKNAKLPNLTYLNPYPSA